VPLPGGDASALNSPRQTRLLAGEASGAVGGGRGGGAGVAMPETAGLLHDDTFYYLALLRRWARAAGAAATPSLAAATSELVGAQCLGAGGCCCCVLLPGGPRPPACSVPISPSCARRYVLYGPTMGLTTASGAFGQAKPSAYGAGLLTGGMAAALGPRASVASLGGVSTAASDPNRASLQQLRV
jgi:hypothetical protein